MIEPLVTGLGFFSDPALANQTSGGCLSTSSRRAISPLAVWIWEPNSTKPSMGRKKLHDSIWKAISPPTDKAPSSILRPPMPRIVTVERPWSNKGIVKRKIINLPISCWACRALACNPVHRVKKLFSMPLALRVSIILIPATVSPSIRAFSLSIRRLDLSRYFDIIWSAITLVPAIARTTVAR